MPEVVRTFEERIVTNLADANIGSVFALGSAYNTAAYPST
jgi:hypothetical protein